MLGMIHGDAGEATFWVRFHVIISFDFDYIPFSCLVILAHHFFFDIQGMVRYGQAHGDDPICRHAILAILGETDNSDAGVYALQRLKNQCATTDERNVGTHCKTVTEIINTLGMLDEDCTLNQIVT